ncbi:MAG TPA: response regulator transcription factor [Bacteroidia bacterium]|nr:response regulator transcription factor [Bacteroidia bacterium]
MMHRSIVIVDDHRLFSSALAELIGKFTRYSVLYEVQNGKELIERMKHVQNVPDIILLDINMPVMNGFETAEWLRKSHPEVRVLAVSMNDDEESVINMIRAGAHGYVLKDIGPLDLEKALECLVEKGTYYSELVTQHMASSIAGSDSAKKNDLALNERERAFLQWACSELTYKEIADKMCVSMRTVDGYREALFLKLEVKNRVGLVLYAIANKLVKI